MFSSLPNTLAKTSIIVYHRGTRETQSTEDPNWENLMVIIITYSQIYRLKKWEM